MSDSSNEIRIIQTKCHGGDGFRLARFAFLPANLAGVLGGGPAQGGRNSIRLGKLRELTRRKSAQGLCGLCLSLRFGPDNASRHGPQKLLLVHRFSQTGDGARVNRAAVDIVVVVRSDDYHW